MSWHAGLKDELNRLIDDIGDLEKELESGNVIAALKQAQEVVDSCRSFENTLDE